MSPKEFVNYLNGALELGGLTQITPENYQKLVSKLKTVKADTSKENAFCTWLQGVTDSVDEPRFTDTQFTKVTNKLNEVMSANSHYPSQTTPTVPNSGSSHGIRC